MVLSWACGSSRRRSRGILAPKPGRTAVPCQDAAMSEITIGRARPGDLGEILRDYERFWGEHTLPRYLHHPMFVYEFGDTAFVARRAGGQIAGYLVRVVAPPGDGYIHSPAAVPAPPHVRLRVR